SNNGGPPSWFMPAWKETLVLVDGFWNRSPSVFPSSKGCAMPRYCFSLSSAASVKRLSTSALDTAATSSKSLLNPEVRGEDTFMQYPRSMRCRLRRLSIKDLRQDFHETIDLRLANDQRRNESEHVVPSRVD